MSSERLDVERLKANLDAVRDRIIRACEHSGRPTDAVKLVAVTKMVPAAWAATLVEFGQTELGENYPQELWKKLEVVSSPPARWHLIGHLQGNKAKKTYPLVSRVHAVDSLKLLNVLDDLAASLPEPGSVLLQVNCSGEETKHGWAPEQILQDAEKIAAYQHVPVVGLMTMAAQGTTAEEARPAFIRLREIRDELESRSGLSLPELSMGMSNDYDVAVREGSTWVRVGSSLFEGVGA